MNTMMETHEAFMRLALEQARIASAAGDVPVGAVIVVDGNVVAVGHNRRETDIDPTAHAEVIALRAAAAKLGSWHVEASLYVTQEPCPMCAGAIVNARVRELVFGCTNPKAGAVVTLYQLVTDHRLNHRVGNLVGGVLAEDCAAELKKFFAALRSRSDGSTK